MYLVQTTGQDVFITIPKNKLEPKTQMVVIGKDLQLKTVERIFNQAIAKSTKSFFNLRF